MIQRAKKRTLAAALTLALLMTQTALYAQAETAEPEGNPSDSGGIASTIMNPDEPEDTESGADFDANSSAEDVHASEEEKQLQQAPALGASGIAPASANTIRLTVGGIDLPLFDAAISNYTFHYLPGTITQGDLPTLIGVETTGNVVVDQINQPASLADTAMVAVTINGIQKTYTIQLQEAAQIYASDLDWAVAEAGRDVVRRDETLDGTAKLSLYVGGVTRQFEKGIGTHAYSTVVIDIEGWGFDMFESYVGVDADEDRPNADCQFEVYVDGALAYLSGYMKDRMDAEFIQVPVTGAKEITLIVNLGSDGSDDDDHSDWADAKFIKYEPGSVTGLTIDNPPATLNLGDTFSLRAVTQCDPDENGRTKPVLRPASWSVTPADILDIEDASANPAVFEVVGIGEVTITAQSSGMTEELTVECGITTYTLTLEAGAGGSITLGKSGQYRADSKIDITASPDNNHTFDRWEASGGWVASTSAASTTFTMPAADATVTAHFTPKDDGNGGTEPTPTTYTLTMQTQTGGSITQGSSGQYEAGESITITANANSGYTFNGWHTSNGGSFGNAGSLSTTFTMPANATTVTAQFKPNGTTSSGGGSSNSGNSGSSGGGSSTPDGQHGKTQLPASAFSWDSDRTLTISHDSVTALGLLSVRWDGRTLTPCANFTAHQGSVIIRFDQDFMAAQAPGDHTVRVEFLNHYGETTVTVGGAGASTAPGGGDSTVTGDTHNPNTGGDNTDNPQTGDFDSSPWWWLVALIPSAGAAVWITLAWRRRTRGANA